MTLSTGRHKIITMTKKNNTAPHHHGNLREALINAGLELLETGGTQALTLRKCAALAGVSHAAPANHFNGLISLKVAIMARGHFMFTEAMQQANAQAETSPWNQLNATCEAYITFARTHKTLFHLMFQSGCEELEGADKQSMSENQQACEASYGTLQQVCLPFEHTGNNALNTETMVWSLVHGYAMLFADKDCAMQDVPEFSEILPRLKLK
ncbi:TetR/AcrR family transcriptional regulator [Leucothrix arctica]|uniref:TetR/AcrR family transcriptional regulator n=1 Tax=Leucothrix arctica TaxID=1481894 RepID=A0A317C4J5_9GAMM|nr:TetR/AcrR family transcriptional regulator [Leucothrix arctica]PWQ93227.1 TetR/AcrR family transcriptional regulator [Leucothrix arctica]